MKFINGILPLSYLIAIDIETETYITLEAFIDKKGYITAWAIKRDGLIWSKSEKGFVYNPLPSNREEDFKNDTRFQTLYAARRYIREHMGGQD